MKQLIYILSFLCCLAGTSNVLFTDSVVPEDKVQFTFDTGTGLVYQGQYFDEETELAYNRFRYYSPDTGSYISQDPIGLAGNNPNFYAYVWDSNSWVDVFGLDCKVKIKDGDGITHDIVAIVKKSDFGEAAKHLDDIANGKVHTIMRSMAKSNRKASLKGIPTKKGFDRDEVPMAMFKEGGAGASVRYINPSDNRGAGSAIGAALKDYPDGTKVLFKIVN
ncbi:RHS repeat-associated core domain-containing protein [Aquimarina muelleri]|uniref:RHS repeat-associated core domain-containing protein n=1 Tax=Aquimarina muelleri TaxID=279356 RepID=UPI003F682CE2